MRIGPDYKRDDLPGQGQITVAEHLVVVVRQQSIATYNTLARGQRRFKLDETSASIL